MRLIADRENISQENVIVVGDYVHADYLFDQCGYRVCGAAELSLTSASFEWLRSGHDRSRIRFISTPDSREI